MHFKFFLKSSFFSRYLIRDFQQRSHFHCRLWLQLFVSLLAEEILDSSCYMMYCLFKKCYIHRFFWWLFLFFSYFSIMWQQFNFVILQLIRFFLSLFLTFLFVTSYYINYSKCLNQIFLFNFLNICFVCHIHFHTKTLKT